MLSLELLWDGRVVSHEIDTDQRFVLLRVLGSLHPFEVGAKRVYMYMYIYMYTYLSLSVSLSRSLSLSAPGCGCRQDRIFSAILRHRYAFCFGPWLGLTMKLVASGLTHDVTLSAEKGNVNRGFARLLVLLRYMSVRRHAEV